MKKLICMFLVIILTMGITVGCGNKTKLEGNVSSSAQTDKNAESTIAATTADEEPVELTAVWGVQQRGWDLKKDNLLEKILKEKFNVKVKWLAQIPGEDANTAGQKLMLMFTSGEYPDWVVNMNIPNVIKTLGKQGLIQEVTPLLDKVPNYRKMFSDDEWNYTVNQQMADNGKLYFMPQYRPQKSITTWLYRKDVFDKLGLKFPATPDEMFDTLMKLKKAYPDSTPIAGRWGWAGTSGGFQYMFNAVESMNADPYSGQFIPFMQATNEWREAVKLMNKLYKNELLDKEFMTQKDAQWQDLITTGKVFMQFCSAGYIVNFNIWNKSSDPSAEWAYSNDLIHAYPDKKLYALQTPGQQWGVIISDKLKDERLDRFLKFIDWISTDEGLIFQDFGIEGITCKKVDGKIVFNDDVVSAFGRKPNLPLPEALGLSQITAWSRDYIFALYGTDANLVFGDQITARPEYKAAKVYTLSFEDPAVLSKFADMKTQLTDKANEYAAKFAMGVLDPSNDKVWDQYINELEKLKLKEYGELSAAQYEKQYKK